MVTLLVSVKPGAYVGVLDSWREVVREGRGAQARETPIRKAISWT